MNPIPQTKFVLLGQQRTGTNHLLSMLGAHPGILAFGEIFSSPMTIQWGNGIQETIRKKLPPADAVLVAERNAEPIDFLRTHIFGSHATPYRAVGFKLFYQHCREGKATAVWDWLESATEVKIIHLKRRNILRTLLSKRLANATKVWFIKATSEKDNTAPPQPATIALAESDCREFFERTLLAEREADWVFRRHACFNIYYEDLEQDPASTLAAVQTFLGVNPIPASSKLAKQQTLPLSKAIENHAALKAAFAKNHTRIFFDG